jgi:hypothetical protein
MFNILLDVICHANHDFVRICWDAHPGISHKRYATRGKERVVIQYGVLVLGYDTHVQAVLQSHKPDAVGTVTEIDIS